MDKGAHIWGSRMICLLSFALLPLHLRGAQTNVDFAWDRWLRRLAERRTDAGSTRSRWRTFTPPVAANALAFQPL